MICGPGYLQSEVDAKAGEDIHLDGVLRALLVLYLNRPDEPASGSGESFTAIPQLSMVGVAEDEPALLKLKFAGIIDDRAVDPPDGIVCL